jgi:hypothetical protein
MQIRTEKQKASDFLRRGSRPKPFELQLGIDVIVPRKHFYPY